VRARCECVKLVMLIFDRLRVVGAEWGPRIGSPGNEHCGPKRRAYYAAK